MKNKWEEVYTKREDVSIKDMHMHKPQQEIINLVSLFKKEKVKKILDLGCGSGRHVIYLANQGFDMYGLDSAESGLERTKKHLKKEKLKATLIKADCYERLPFKNDFFDVIISTRVIHHAVIEDIRFCISEIERVLKSKGFVFITVAKNKTHKLRTKVKNIAPRTFVPLDGHEVGMPHYLYNEELLRKDFKNFKILDFFEDTEQHYCLLGRLKTQPQQF